MKVAHSQILLDLFLLGAWQEELRLPPSQREELRLPPHKRR